MLFPPIDPNERFRQRRAASRRRKRQRRGALIGASLAGITVLGVGAKLVGGRPAHGPGAISLTQASGNSRPAALPVEIRGVHVTMGLASLAGRLERYLDLRKDGLTTLELDVKDERGQVAFASRESSLALHVRAVRPFYSPRSVA